jgi:hypothetical protein
MEWRSYIGRGFVTSGGKWEGKDVKEPKTSKKLGLMDHSLHNDAMCIALIG